MTFLAYDANNNLLKRVDGNRVETDYTHSADPQSLLTNVHYVYPSGYTGGTTGDVSLAYDAYGRRASMTDGTGSQNYVYDDVDNTLSNTTTYTGLPAQSITYGYYPNGSRQNMGTPAGGFSYTYDAVGRMTGLTNPYSEASSWQYLDNGWLSTQTLGNNAVTAHTYNGRGQTTDLQTRTSGGTLVSDFSNQTYSGVGDRLSVTANLPTVPAIYSGTTLYQYDGGQTVSPAFNRSQLTQEQSTRSSGYTDIFAYDGGGSSGPGNPTAFQGASHTFNADNQDTASPHDGNGNPSGTTYSNPGVGTFDPENRLTVYGSYSPSPRFAYNGDGLRVYSGIPAPQGSTIRTYYLYDGTVPVCELNASGNITGVNTFGANGLLSRHFVTVSAFSPPTTHNAFYTFDPSGNVAQQLDGSGAVVSTDLYGGFGAVQNGGGSPFGFAGQWGGYTGPGTGLVLMTHRYYDPAAGRFITRDPIGYAGGINLYAYTGNDPVNRADPLGLWSVSIGVGGIVAIPGGGFGGDIAITIGDGGIGITGDTYSGVGVGVVAAGGVFVGGSPDPLEPGSSTGTMDGFAGSTDIGEGGSGSYWHTPPGAGGVSGWKGGPSWGFGSGGVAGNGTTFSNIHPWPQPAPYDNGTGSSCPTNWHEGDGNGGNTSPGQFM